MMTSLVPSLSLSPPPQSQSPSSSSSRLNPSSVSLSVLQSPPKSKTLGPNRSPKPRRRRFIPLAVDLTVGNPEDPSRKFETAGALDSARHLFDNLPQLLKKFPWAKTLENFLGIVADLACAVVKYLSIPALALTQLSEMSYCAHERKMALVPVPFLVGFAVAGALKDTAIEVYPDVKEGGFPWHLFIITILFALLKLPGPYYPYWGRLLIPHFANGGLWRSIWLIFMWYRGIQSSSLADNS